MRPKLLDLFCCAGGAGMGYSRAGFDVIGVDISHQPHYPFRFIQADAIKVLELLLDGRVLEINGEGFTLDDFAAAHASPPCQAFTNAQKIQGNAHPDLIEPTRELLSATGLPWVIENVPGAPLIDPVELCGSMFELGTYRHRLFETSWYLDDEWHPEHVARTTKMGRKPVAGEFMHIVGHFSGVAEARAAMDIDWMTRDELREAIPPAYTEYVGKRLIRELAVAV